MVILLSLHYSNIHTQLKARFVNVQLASGVIKGISVNKAFKTTMTKMVVNQAPMIYVIYQLNSYILYVF